MTISTSPRAFAPLAVIGPLCLFAGLLAGLSPGLAIGLALGAAFTLLVFADLAAGLVVFAALSFLEFSPLLSEAGGVTKIAGALLALGWLARSAVDPAVRPRQFTTDHPFISFVLLAFLGWSVVSVTWAKDVEIAIGYLQRYVLVIALLAITYTAVSDRRRAIWIVAIVIVGSLVTALYGLAEPPAPEDAERITSTVGNANVLATILVSGLVLALAAAVAFRHQPAVVIACLGVTGVCMLAFFFTGSRSGLVALLAVVLVAPLIAGKRRRTPMIAGGLCLLMLSGAFFFALAPQDIRDRLATTSPGELPAEEGRTTLWKVGWRMVEDRPIQGVGIGNFANTTIDYLIEPGQTARSDQVVDDPKVAHNIYLHTLAELGVVGFVLLGTVLVFALGCCLKAARIFARDGDGQMEILSRALFLALVAILVADFFASEQYSKILWLLLAMGPVMLALAREAARHGGGNGGRSASPAAR